MHRIQCQSISDSTVVTGGHCVKVPSFLQPAKNGYAEILS